MTPAAVPRWIELPGQTQLLLSGGDRLRFLNGQVTTDVRKLDPGIARAACVLTAKGKLCALVRVAAENEAYRIDADAPLREELIARIERYIIADDVLLEDVTEHRVLLHLAGPVPDGLPTTPVATCATDRFGIPGTDLIVAAPDAPAARAFLTGQLGESSPDFFEQTRIDRAVPVWGSELGPDTLPPEAGLDATAIDYDKGCYLGQEIISRLRSVGHVNRKLCRLGASAKLIPGMTLAGPAGEPAGTITSAAPSFALDNWMGLGYLKKLFWTPGTRLAANLPGSDTAIPVEVLPNHPA